MVTYSGKDWPFPWDNRKHIVPKEDIVPRLETAILWLGGRENPYAELHVTAVDEIIRLRKLCKEE